MIEREEVQGNVLRSYGEALPCARYLLFELEADAARRTRGQRRRLHARIAARATVQSWLDGISFGVARPAHGPPFRLGIGFTSTGLEAMGVGQDLLEGFPEEFRTGARGRADGNGDDPEAGWHDRLGHGHVLLSIHARTPEERDERAAEILAACAPSVRVTHDLKAQLLDAGWAGTRLTNSPQPTCDTARAREHFGFADGCSQPAIEGVDDDPVGDGVYARLPPQGWRALKGVRLMTEDLGITRVPRRWRTIRAGEFVLGYENEDGVLAPGSAPPLGPNGTFMVYRVIQQHVTRFVEYVATEAERLGLDADLLRAKIVGRWRDGTPVALSPDRPDRLVAADRRRANDFLYRETQDGYRDDPSGFGCPLGAHVRRANPRDALPGGAERTMGHRIIRRGMPYAWRDDQKEKGLAFVAFGASIADGFEFIQRRWFEGGDAFGLGDERDLLLQQGARLTGMVVPGPGDGSVVLRPPPTPFTTVRGCEYLFVPARGACAWLRAL